MASRIAVLRIHQRDASLDARERVAALAAALSPRADVIALSTCHRVELYAAVGAGDPRAEIAARIHLDPQDAAHATLEIAADAVAHLFRTACGLDSAVQGEGQILGQVRAAHERARSAGPVDPALAIAFQRALHLARRLRATTALGEIRRSVGSIAVDEIVRRLPEAETATVLVVGAGEMGKLASRALASRVGRVIVANRDRARAEAVALEVDGLAVGLDSLPAALAEADAVISAADTRGTVLDAPTLDARCHSRGLLVIDIAVPRSVAEDARGLAGLTYLTVDDLAAIEAAPADVIAEAERQCAAEAALLAEEFAIRATSATPLELRARLEPLRQRSRVARG